MAEEQHELKIKIKIDKDTKQLTVVDANLQEFAGTVNKVKKETHGANDSIGQLDSSLSSILQPLGLNIKQFTTLAGAVTLVTSVIKTGISEWEKESAIERETAAILKGLGIEYANVKTQIENTLAALRDHTRYTDTETKKAFSSAVKYTGDVESAYRLLKIAMDVATTFGKGLSETIDTLGLSMRGNRIATRRLYDDFGALGVNGATAEEKVRNLGKAVEDNRIKEEGLTKSSRQLKDAFDETAEVIGKNLNPYLAGASGLLSKIVVVAVSGFNLMITNFLTFVDTITFGMTAVVNIFQSGFKVIANAAKLNFKAAGDEAANLFYRLGKTAKDTQDEILKRYKDINQKFAEQLGIREESHKQSDAKIKDRHIQTVEDMFAADEEQTRKVKEFIEDTKKTSEEAEKAKLEAHKATNEQAIASEQKKTQMFADLKMQELKNTYITESQKLQIVSDFAGQMASVFKDMGDVGKAFAIAQATIDAYAAGTKALATYPPPFSFIAMATAIAAGLANVAKITSVHFEKGGIVKEQTIGVLVEGGKKEAVIPLDSPTGKRILGTDRTESTSSSVNINSIVIQFPNVSSFEDWRRADPRVIKDVMEKKMLYAMKMLANEGKIEDIVKAKTI